LLATIEVHRRYTHLLWKLLKWANLDKILHSNIQAPRLWSHFSQELSMYCLWNNDLTKHGFCQRQLIHLG